VPLCGRPDLSTDCPLDAASATIDQVVGIRALSQPAPGAQFLTPPKQHETEMRCYIRDPDGYLIEVGQTTLPRGWRPPS
jgi:catechol 2,3-dioxygenase-like lactoylglutathione lyase family enzyme